MTLPYHPANADGHPTKTWLSRCRWFLAIAALAVLAMGVVVRNDFSTWDDPHTIVHHQMFNPPTWDGKDGILSAWDVNKPIGALYVPVTYTVWGIFAELAWMPPAGAVPGKLNPAYFHLASLLGHIVTSVTVFALISRLLRSRGEDRAWPAFFGAALFAAHPLQVEAIGWTSGLKDVLWVMWAMLAVYAYVRSAERALLWRSRWWWAGLLFFALSTLSKPTGMVTAGLALVVHRLAMGRPWREVARGLWAWFPLAIAAAAWARHFQPAEVVPTLALPYRPLIALDSMAFYLWKTFVPFNIGFDYGRSPQVALANGWLYWTWVFPVAIGTLLFVKRKQWPLGTAGAAWAVVAVAPVLGLTPFLYQYFSTVADHYMYGATAGVGMAAAWGLSRLPPRLVRPSQFLASLAVLALAALAFRQTNVWHDNLSLYTHGEKVNPKSYIAETNIGGVYMYEAVLNSDVPRMNAAVARFQRAIELRPDYPLVHHDYALALIYLNRRDEARRQIEVALELNEQMPFELRDDFSQQHVVLAEYLLKERNFDEEMRRRVIAHYEAAIRELRRGHVTDEKRYRDIEAMIVRARHWPTSRPTTTRSGGE